MKSLLCTLAILMCVSAQAAPSAQQLESAEQALYSADCVNALEAGVYTLTAISEENKKTVQSNLNVYQSWVGQAITNIDNHQSNAGIYKNIKDSLATHENTYAGKAISWCVSNHTSFSGTPAQQKQQLKVALSKIYVLQKAAK